MNLQQLDLNLVVALDALLRHQSVTRAAEELGVSQPAMSQALSRLRGSLGDPLLERRGRHLVPTPTAVAMREPVAQALSSLSTALFPATSFDPSTATAVVTLGVDPYFHAVLVPRLAHVLSEEAPGLQLHATQLSHDDVGQALATGRVDAAIIPGHLSIEDMSREPLITDTYRVAVRREHPRGQRRLSLRDCGELSQVLLAPGGPWASELAHALREEGLVPHYAVVTDQLPVAVDTLTRTDHYMVLPRRVAEQYRTDRLRVLSPPVELGTCSRVLVWHPRATQDPLQRYLRGRVRKLARNVYTRRRLMG